MDHIHPPPHHPPHHPLPSLPSFGFVEGYNLSTGAPSSSTGAQQWMEGVRVGFDDPVEARFEMLDEDQEMGGQPAQQLVQGEDDRHNEVDGENGQVADGEHNGGEGQQPEQETEPSNSIAPGVEKNDAPQIESQAELAMPSDLPSQPVQDAHQEADAESSTRANGQAPQPDQDQAQDQARTQPLSIDPSSVPVETQAILHALAMAPDLIVQPGDAPPGQGLGDVDDGDEEVEEAEPVKKGPFQPPDGGFTMDGKVRVPKNVEFKKDEVLHGIQIQPLTTFISSLSPLPLAKVHKILLNCKTPKSHQRIDARLATWETEEVEVREEVPIEDTSTLTAANRVGMGMMPATKPADETIANPILRELRIDMSTLHPSALYRLEEFRRHHLSLPDLEVDFITYLRWKTIDKAEAERLTLEADRPLLADTSTNGDVVMSTPTGDAAPLEPEANGIDLDAHHSPPAKVHQSSESEFEAPTSKRSLRTSGEPARKRGRPRKNKDNEVKAVVAEEAEVVENGANDGDARRALLEDSGMIDGPLEDANDTPDAEMVANDTPVDESRTLRATNSRTIKPATARGQNIAIVEVPVASRGARRISGGESSIKSPIVALRSSMRGKGRQPPATPEGGRSLHFPRPNHRKSRSVSFDIPDDDVEIVDSMDNRKRGTPGQNGANAKPKGTGRRGRPKGSGKGKAREEASAGPLHMHVDNEENENKKAKKKLRTIVEVVIPIRKPNKSTKSIKLLGKRRREPSDEPHAHVLADQQPFAAIPHEAAGHVEPPPVNGQGPPRKRRRPNFEGTEPAMGHVVPDHEVEREDGYNTSKSKVEAGIEVYSEAEEAEAEAEMEVESDAETTCSDEWPFLS